MRQQVVKNLLFVLVINVLIKTVWIFFIDRNVQLSVGYSQYGAYQALFNLGMIFQILLDFGLTQYSSKTISSDHKQIKELFASMFWMRMILIVVYTVLVSSVAIILGYKGILLQLLIGVLFIQSMNSMLVFVRSCVAALHHFRTDGVLAVIDRFLMIIVCGCLLIIPFTKSNFKIEWFVWSQIACYLVAVIISFIVLFRITPEPIHFAFNPKIIRNVIVKSFPYALLVFLMSVYMRADSVMIERLCGEEGKMQAGIYASAFRLLDVANIFGVMFAGMLMPMFAKMIVQKENVAAMVKLSVNIMMPIAFVVALTAIFFGEDIMLLLYHKASNTQDGTIFALLMCSFPAYCLMYVYSTLLTANGSIRLLNKISIIVVVINLALHFYFIPILKSEGAAVSVLITEWFVAAMVIYFSHKTFSLPHNLVWLLSHIGFVVAETILIFIIKQSTHFLPVQLLLIMISSVLLLFAFRFWTLTSFKELFKR